MLGLSIPYGYIHIVLWQYTNFAKKHLIEFDDVELSHNFWHPFYLGFGFLKVGNTQKIKWDDAFGEKKVRETLKKQSFTTKEHENILKNEVFELFKYQIGFVIWTIFAKLGILFWYFLLFGNIGILAFCFVIRQWYLDISFFCALGLSSITPILGLPYYSYSLGFITFAFLLGLFYINEFLQQHYKGWLYCRKESVSTCC